MGNFKAWNILKATLKFQEPGGDTSAISSETMEDEVCPKAHSMSFLTASCYVANILSFDPGIASETVEMNIGHLG